ncbi:hypothetical protein HDU87_001964 [Geranomyces variabilis]|uniref:Tail specific protease domain-containing protein n=1 Tax=Geranomyces variabilis TaxID=109894 RepID=A0AAD5TLY0_9FUNG|nr:hypothetical protein HDU87_001964 [Geranomyces variabilis]
MSVELVSISTDKHMGVSFRGATRPQNVELTPDEEHMDFAKEGAAEARILPGHIGYVNLKAFPLDTSAAQVYAGLFNMFAGTRALIVDVRDNGGGASAVDLFLSYRHPGP